MLAQDLIEMAKPLKELHWAQGNFFQAYGYFVLGDMVRAADETEAGARLSDLETRAWFLQETFTVEFFTENETKSIAPQ